MSWLDEIFGITDDAPDQGSLTGGSGVTGPGITDTGSLDDRLSNALLGISDAFGGSLPDWLSSSSVFQNYSSQVSGQQAQPLEKQMAAKGDSGNSLLDRVGGFVEKNKALSEIVLRGVGGAVAAKNAKQAAEKSAQSRIAELQEADRLKQAQNARMSASVTGLKKPGLIARQMPLRRADGTPVYGANGRIGG